MLVIVPKAGNFCFFLSKTLRKIIMNMRIVSLFFKREGDSFDHCLLKCFFKVETMVQILVNATLFYLFIYN